MSEATVEAAVDAFILFNERESAVAEVVAELDRRRITTYFWRRDIPVGERWRDEEERRLQTAGSVVVFLGAAGWGKNHLPLTLRAREVGRRIIPVLLAEPPEGALDDAAGLFNDLRYFELRKIDSDGLDRLAAVIRGESDVGAQTSSEPRSDSRPVQPSEDDPSDAGVGSIIRVLVDGNEEQRADMLHRVMLTGRLNRPALAARLRREIEQNFSFATEDDLSSAIRDPAKVPSIRAWMLSCLIWIDANSPASRDVIFRHLSRERERWDSVRFWCLAGLYQCKAQYLAEAIALATEDPQLEIRVLSRAIAGTDRDDLIAWGRDGLGSDSGATWAFLRVLRVVPIVELVPDVCRRLLAEPATSTLAYDALYALTHPDLAREAAAILGKDPGVGAVVQLVLAIARDSDGAARRNFAGFLDAFDADAVGQALASAKRVPGTAAIAGAISQRLGKTGSRAVADQLFVAVVASDTFDAAADDLDIERDVKTLAAVMLARKATPPLAIGLFGDWGSGKSHFMAALREATRGLATRAKSDPESAFCSDIVSIEFNAWHYMDSNLWASLVSHILQELAAHVTPKLRPEEQQQQLIQQLDSAKAVVEGAKAEQTVAREDVSTRQKDLEKLAADRRNMEIKLEDLRIPDLRRLLDGNPAVKQQIGDALVAVGAPRLVQSLDDLSQVVSEAASLKGRASALRLSVLGQPTILVLTGVVLIGIPALGWAIRDIVASDGLVTVGAVVAEVVTVVTGATTLLKRGLASAGAALDRLQAAKQRVDDLVAAKRATPTPEERALEGEIAKLVAKELEATKRLDVATQRVVELEERIRSIEEGRSLVRFLSERTRSEDYRKHLGLISTIRQDFESLGPCLAAAAEAAKAAGKDGKRVDRIVLYIDDLDRCHEEKVMEVLQAVHLLLAFPLFVVVVGVDPRWLTHSLESTYGAFRRSTEKGALTPGRIATPQDYLEKIFQIPFTLRPMTQAGFAALVTRQLAPRVASVAEPARASSVVTSVPVNPVSEASPPSERAPSVTEARTAPTDPLTPPEAPAPAPSPAPRSAFRVHDEALRIQPWEAAFAADVFPLIPTPRAAKRFTNIYRLLKAPLPPSKLVDFEGTAEISGSFRVPMVLLALVVGSAVEAAKLFPRLRDEVESDGDAVALLERIAADPADPAHSPLLAKLLPIVTAQDFPRSPEVFREWLPRVARFSFQMAGLGFTFSERTADVG